jgi:hypothetical protein
MTLRTFELVAGPGLLQTEDYARVMLRTHVMATDDEVDEMVAARGRTTSTARRG